MTSYGGHKQSFDIAPPVHQSAFPKFSLNSSSLILPHRWEVHQEHTVHYDKKRLRTNHYHGFLPSQTSPGWKKHHSPYPQPSERPFSESALHSGKKLSLVHCFLQGDVRVTDKDVAQNIW